MASLDHQHIQTLQYNLYQFYINPIRSGGGALKAPIPIFCPHAFNFRVTLLCFLGLFPKNSLTSCGIKKILIGGYNLAVRGVSKFKVDMIFIIFREFNTMLEMVVS